MPDSLEPIDQLDGSEHAHIQLVNCNQWPFYSGGHPHSNRYSASHSHSSSSSSDDSSDDREFVDSLLPSTITADSPLYGFDDGVETTKCLLTTDSGICAKWIVTKQEYEDKYGCGEHLHAESLTSYALCLCATFAGNYCAEWACLNKPDYPTDPDSYSLIKDNQFIMDKVDTSNPLIGDLWRFATDDGMVELSQNMKLKNCWCQSSAGKLHPLSIYILTTNIHPRR